eukprot:scaffold49172_cov20-Tisochrysis_lutea.AAC.1
MGPGQALKEAGCNCGRDMMRNAAPSRCLNVTQSTRGRMISTSGSLLSLFSVHAAGLCDTMKDVHKEIQENEMRVL